jgi:uncharacterized BrkB/YihY/UPF0761 family membrane protein
MMNKFDIVNEWWIRVNSDGGMRRNTYILIGFFIFKFIFGIAIMDLVATALIAIAIFYHYTPWGVFSFIIGISIFTLTSWFLFTIFAMIGAFYLYKYLEKRRIKKIEDIANKSVNELSGVSKSDAEVEIVIRGND